MPLRDGLIAHWRLEEASGSRYDSHSEYDLSEVYGVDRAAGKLGYAAEFPDGETGYLTVGSIDDQPLGLGDTNFTITFWARAASLGGLLLKWSSNCLSVYTIEDGVLVVECGGTSYEADTFPTDTWVFVAIDYRASDNRLRVHMSTTQSWTVTAPSTADTLIVGDDVFQTGDKWVDSLSVWGRILSDSERAAVYNSGDGLEYSEFSATNEASGSATATASTEASAEIVVDGFGSATATASTTGQGEQTHAATGAATATASAEASAEIVVDGSGSATATGSTTGQGEQTHAATGSATATASAEASAEIVVDGSGFATATGATTGQGHQIHAASGSAIATASASGSAAGVIAAEGYALGLVSASGTATQIHAASGSATATASASGSASGVVSTAGYALGLVSASGTASQTHAATGSATATGSASGSADIVLAATGSASASASASGEAELITGGIIEAQGSAVATASATGAAVMVVSAAGTCYAIASAAGQIRLVVSGAGYALGLAQAIGRVYGTPQYGGAAGWYKGAERPASTSVPASPAFHRARRATSGQAVTSRHLKSLSRAINDRLRSGLGDGAWRVAYYGLGLFRQMRRPDASEMLWPTQAEFFEAYQMLRPGQGDWPLGLPGLPEGANVANPLCLYIWGHDGSGIGDEGVRLGQVPLVLPDGRSPETVADYRRLGKLQRGAADLVSGGAVAPAWSAARSWDVIRPDWIRSPHLSAYGGWQAAPDLQSTLCEDPNAYDGFPAPPNYALRFTVTAAGEAVGLTTREYAGTCPIGPSTTEDYSAHVATVVNAPWAWYVVLNSGQVDTLPKAYYTEGPYNGAPRIRKSEGHQLARVLQAFASTFRGVDQNRTAASAWSEGAVEKPDSWLKGAFDTDWFFTRQYRLAPARGSGLAGGVAAEYPRFAITAPSNRVLAAGTPIPRASGGSTAHAVASGCVVPAGWVRASGLAGPATVEWHANGRLRARAALTPDAPEQIVEFGADVPAGESVTVRVGDAVRFHAGGRIDVEVDELIAYKPDLSDWFLCTRLGAAA